MEWAGGATNTPARGPDLCVRRSMSKSIVLYHSTPARRLASILRHGILPELSRGGGPGRSSGCTRGGACRGHWRTSAGGTAPARW
jgi:hypothetical protein